MKNIKISQDGDQIKISWDKVEDADYYEVSAALKKGIPAKIDGTSVSLNGNLFEDGKQVTFSIIAYSRQDNLKPSEASTQVFNYFAPTATPSQTLASVANVKISQDANNVRISWDAVEHADYYEVSVTNLNGYHEKVSGTSVTLPNSSFEDGKQVTITIIAGSNSTLYENSVESITNYNYIAPTPTPTPTPVPTPEITRNLRRFQLRQKYRNRLQPRARAKAATKKARAAMETNNRWYVRRKDGKKGRQFLGCGAGRFDQQGHRGT